MTLYSAKVTLEGGSTAITEVDAADEDAATVALTERFGKITAVDYDEIQ